MRSTVGTDFDDAHASPARAPRAAGDGRGTPASPGRGRSHLELAYPHGRGGCVDMTRVAGYVDVGRRASFGGMCGSGFQEGYGRTRSWRSTETGAWQDQRNRDAIKWTGGSPPRIPSLKGKCATMLKLALGDSDLGIRSRFSIHRNGGLRSPVVRIGSVIQDAGRTLCRKSWNNPFGLRRRRSSSQVGRICKQPNFMRLGLADSGCESLVPENTPSGCAMPTTLCSCSIIRVGGTWLTPGRWP